LRSLPDRVISGEDMLLAPINLSRVVAAETGVLRDELAR
jgi:hypothetical protein